MATFAQQTQQMAGEPASSTSVTTNSFSTLPSSSSSTTDIIQPILAITNALSSITLHSPIRASSPPAAPSTQVASALALCQTSPPRAPKTSNDVRDGVVAVVKEVTSTEDAAQKTVGPTQHPDFTFDDGNVTLKAGHRLFTVHRYAFMQHSPVFMDMFSLGPESTTEGTKENPIDLHLDADQAVHFERLLRVIYPLRFDELPFKTAVEWHSVLVAADMFQFRECGIWKLAVEQLQKTAPFIQMISWGTKYEIKALLVQGYVQACNRNVPLTAKEVEEVAGVRPLAVELIMRKREALLDAFERCGSCPRTRAQVFGDELGIHFQTSTNEPTKLQTPLFVINETQASQALRPVKPLPARNSPSRSRQSRPKFAFDGGDVSFAVEDASFTVPRFFMLLESPAFQTMFAQESTINNSSGKGTKEDPLILKGISRVDFEKFLKILYPRFIEHGLQTADDWRFVLHVANILQVTQSDIRALSVSRIHETASAVQKILWGEKYGSKFLLNAGCRELCNRDDCLTVAEILDLNPQTVELISRKREQLIRASRCEHCARKRIRTIVKEAGVIAHFAELLKESQ